MKGAFFVGEEVYFTQSAAEEAILASGSAETVKAENGERTFQQKAVYLNGCLIIFLLHYLQLCLHC